MPIEDQITPEDQIASEDQIAPEEDTELLENNTKPEDDNSNVPDHGDMYNDVLPEDNMKSKEETPAATDKMENEENRAPSEKEIDDVESLEPVGETSKPCKIGDCMCKSDFYTIEFAGMILKMVK